MVKHLGIYCDWWCRSRGVIARGVRHPASGRCTHTGRGGGGAVIIVCPTPWPSVLGTRLHFLPNNTSSYVHCTLYRFVTAPCTDTGSLIRPRRAVECSDPKQTFPSPALPAAALLSPPFCPTVPLPLTRVRTPHHRT